MRTNELYHHGVKGMHWGVRRYQNPDGTYTNAGKARISGSKKVGLNKAQKDAIKSIIGTTALTALAIGGVSYVENANEFDRTVKALTGNSIHKTINSINEISDNYRKLSDSLDNDDAVLSVGDSILLKTRIDRDTRIARSSYQNGSRALKELENRRSFVSKRRRAELEKARKNVDELRDSYLKLDANGNMLKRSIDNNQDRAYARAREQAKQHNSESRYGSNNQNNQGRTYSRTKSNTANTKSKDRQAKYRNSGIKIDPQKAQARVKELRNKVAKAQKDGTVTAAMIDELQEAMAQAKVARAQMAHSIGFLCYVQRDDSKSLYHHGIKGMHWGVRRYQNPDGTLTAAGKRRAKAEDRAIRREAKKQRMWNAKNTSQLSDKELTDQILRLQREKQLKDLTSQSISPGRKRTKEFLIRNGELILSTAIAAGVTARVNQSLKPSQSPVNIDEESEREFARYAAREKAQQRAAKEGYYTKHYDAHGNLKHTDNNGKKKQKQ